MKAAPAPLEPEDSTPLVNKAADAVRLFNLIYHGLKLTLPESEAIAVSAQLTAAFIGQFVFTHECSLENEDSEK